VLPDVVRYLASWMVSFRIFDPPLFELCWICDTCLIYVKLEGVGFAEAQDVFEDVPELAIAIVG